MLKNIVFGGSGFIGTNLCSYLGLENCIVVDDNPPQLVGTKYYEWGTATTEWASQLKKDDDVHFYVLQSRKIPMFGGRGKSTYDNLISLVATYNIIKYTQEGLYSEPPKSIKVFYASTSDVYGPFFSQDAREVQFLSLGDPSSSRWSYAATKIAGEHLFLGLMEDYNIPVVIGRIFSSYGPYGNIIEPWKAGITQVLLCKAIRNEIVTIYGDGNQQRSYIYIEDLLDAMGGLMNSDHTGVFNLCSDDEPITMNQLAELVGKIHGSDLHIEHKPYEDIKQTKYADIRYKKGNNGKLKSIIKWNQRVGLPTGLKLAYEHLLSRVNAQSSSCN
jgi:nucleoside-diphosphate-sugar epimerase